jgi:uncharacterized protein (UPF0332 family)
MKEIESLIKRANKYIQSAEKLIKEKDYESSVSELIMQCFMLPKQHY